MLPPSSLTFNDVELEVGLVEIILQPEVKPSEGPRMVTIAHLSHGGEGEAGHFSAILLLSRGPILAHGENPAHPVHPHGDILLEIEIQLEGAEHGGQGAGGGCGWLRGGRIPIRR